MSDKKRAAQGGDRAKKKYRSDGTPIWSKRSIDGPGVWVSCVKGKEKQTVGEVYDVFERLAAELWPEEPVPESLEDAAEDVEEDLEKQIAKELATIKKPRKEQRFVVFISCKPPVDPLKLVLKHIENVEETGVTHTRYTQRLTPVYNTCVANEPEIKSLFERALKKFLAEDSDSERAYRVSTVASLPMADLLIIAQYKVELRSRNHNTLSRQTIIDTIAKCTPGNYTVDLEDPELFVLVEVFKVACASFCIRGHQG
ncbi:hypothetical protein EWM64_g380 [Hericium alpestre]|uniref:THUMP domain-containing protein n=1 Tax=Hericium alpestre TaxID=135208 RepID=A0A4Z0ABA8_9AGAM|nr:hypothetical protein EWM64_g380 [Hericium alpestre]